MARTRYKLKRVTPDARPAPRGQVPGTLAALCSEFGLPDVAEPSAGERRVTARNRRTLTLAKRERGRALA
jgi:hypothetical protein